MSSSRKKNIVTVIMAGLNEEDYVADSLNSILNQSWLEHDGHFVEFYIVNDGSTDRTGEEIVRWVKEHKSDERIYGNVNFINRGIESNHYKNKGIVASLNEAVEEFRKQRDEKGIEENERAGICFFDFDDVMEERFVEILMAQLQSTVTVPKGDRKKVGVAYAHGYLIDKKGGVFINKHDVQIAELPTLDFSPKEYLVFGQNYIPTPSMIKEGLILGAFPLIKTDFPNGISKWYRYSEIFRHMAERDMTAKYVPQPLFQYRVGTGENSSGIAASLNSIEQPPSEEILFGYVTDPVLAEVQGKYANLIERNRETYEMFQRMGY